MAREPHPLVGWEVTPTGYATFAAVLAAIIAGVCIGEFEPDTPLGRWLATDTGLFSYWFICAAVISVAQMVLHVLGFPSATKRPADKR